VISFRSSLRKADAPTPNLGVAMFMAVPGAGLVFKIAVASLDYN
jgi:hypothetical protein